MVSFQLRERTTALSIVTNTFFGVVTCREEDHIAVSRCFPSWLRAPVSGFLTPKPMCFPSLRLVLLCKFIQEGLALWLHGSGTYHGAHSRMTSFESFHLFEKSGKELYSRVEHLVGDWEGKDLLEEGHDTCFHATSSPPCPVQMCISDASFFNVDRKDIYKMGWEGGGGEEREELEAERQADKHRCLPASAKRWGSHQVADLAVHAESSETDFAPVLNAVGYQQLTNALLTAIFCCLWRWCCAGHVWAVLTGNINELPLRPGSAFLLKIVLGSLFSLKYKILPCKGTRSVIGREVHVYTSKETFLFVPQKNIFCKYFPLFLHL